MNMRSCILSLENTRVVTHVILQVVQYNYQLTPFHTCLHSTHFASVNYVQKVFLSSVVLLARSFCQVKCCRLSQWETYCVIWNLTYGHTNVCENKKSYLHDLSKYVMPKSVSSRIQLRMCKYPGIQRALCTVSAHNTRHWCNIYWYFLYSELIMGNWYNFGPDLLYSS
jgi:hypothetical protein